MLGQRTAESSLSYVREKVLLGRLVPSRLYPSPCEPRMCAVLSRRRAPERRCVVLPGPYLDRVPQHRSMSMGRDDVLTGPPESIIGILRSAQSAAPDPRL